MAYAQAIADGLSEMFREMGISYEFKEGSKTGLFIFRMKLNCKLQNARLMVIVREDDFSVLAQIPLSADENSRLAVAEYLTRANFNIRNGNFELDMNTGEIRYKTYVHVGEGAMNLKAARLAILLPLMMLDRFGDELLEVIFGYKSPREAFEAVET